MNIQPNEQQINLFINELINFKIANYHKDRNYVYFEEDRFKNVSGLSAFISRGLLKEQTLLKKIISSGNLNEKFIQEIFWRVYWQGWLENYSNTWDKYKKTISCIENKELNDICNYHDAINASTSIEPFNEWVTILKQDGYLHNHARMWFASIWIHYLELPWHLGCKFFYENLLDADVASNLLSWRWVAGLQTYGKKYLATEENINRYTNNRYLGFKLPKVKNISIKNEDKVLNYIKTSKIEDTNKDSAFFLMENNLNLDLFKNLNEKVKVLILIKFNLKIINKNQIVLNFQKKLYKNFVQKNIQENYKYYEFELQKNNSKLIFFLKSKGIKNIIYNYVRVGYEKDILNNFILSLDDSFVIKSILDDFYTESWKYCNKGFFKFKEKIPMLLNKYF